MTITQRIISNYISCDLAYSKNWHFKLFCFFLLYVFTKCRPRMNSRTVCFISYLVILHRACNLYLQESIQNVAKLHSRGFREQMHSLHLLAVCSCVQDTGTMFLSYWKHTSGMLWFLLLFLDVSTLAQVKACWRI